MLTGLVVTLGWGAIGSLWIVTIVRLVAWDRLKIFALLDALTLVLYLPAGSIAVLALWRRRWVLAGASVLMVVAQIVLIMPELSATSALPRNLHAVSTLRIFDANVYQNNPTMAGYAQEIRDDRPDLVTLEEASTTDLAQLVRESALTQLPFRFWNHGQGSRSIIVASRYPLGPTVDISVDGISYLARTTVELPGGPLSLWVVHTTAPTEPGVREWNDELNGVCRLLTSLRPHSMLMVGDFNATWNNRGFRAILGTGVTDAAAARGEALDMTWSQLTTPIPPLIRIDHVLTGPGVVVTSIHSEPGPGSDHRALLAHVVLIGPESGQTQSLH